MFTKVFALAAVTGLTAACVAGYEEEPDQYAEYEQKVIDCNAMNGVNPTKAALAVAMGSELKRWKASDLEIVSRDCDNAYQHVKLTQAAENLCNSPGYGGCPVTKALLQLTDPRLRNEIDQNVFNPVMFCQDLIASFDRQKTLFENMGQNHSGELPPAYSLTNTTSSEPPVEACGQYYWFDAQATPAGTEDNIIFDLCFFGQPNTYHDCGRNPWLSFRTGTGGKVAIDPLDSDLGGTGTAGTCLSLSNATTIPAGTSDGVCCKYPNPNLAGDYVVGTTYTPSGSTQRCSIAAMKLYDPSTPEKYTNLHCHYTSGGVTYKGKLVNNVLAPSYDICNKNL